MRPTEWDVVFDELKTFGLLLESDSKLPSVCTLIAGRPITGSWWSHPLAQTIFQVNELLDDHPDLVITKLLAGKVTFVHRKLWPELFAVANSKESWQTQGLSPSAREVLKSVQKKERVRSDEIRLSNKPTAKIGDAIRQLEQRLLIHSQQVHTVSGKHAKFLETWEQWAKSAELRSSDIAATVARRNLEEIVRKLNEQFDGKATLPWQKLK